MPAKVSERLRRPMDESMLLRLVMVSGLMSGSDLAKFYSQGGGGLDGSQTLEEFLAAGGVDVNQLNSIKRAYVETSDFGSTLLDGLYLRRVDEGRIREMRKALNVCETEQLLAIKRGQSPLPIGEMLVERGLLSRAELEKLIHQQGMISKIERYTSEVRRQPTISERLGVGGLRRRVVSAGAVVVASLFLLLVVLANLWWAGVFRGSPDPFSDARNGAEHVRNLKGHYGNMLAELRRGQTANAGHYRGMIENYCERLGRANVVLDDPDARHIQETLGTLDFDRLEEIPPRDRLRLSQAEIEKRLARKP